MILDPSDPMAGRCNAGATPERDFQRLKTVIHEELVESLDLSMVSQVDSEQLSRQIRGLAEEICRICTGI